jgi:hypothetical protein
MKATLTQEQKEQLLSLIHETIIPAIHEDVIGDYEEEDEDKAMDLYYEAIEFISNNL